MLQMAFNGIFATHQHHLFLPALQLFPGPGVSEPLLKRFARWRVSTRRLQPSELSPGSALERYARACGTDVVAPTYTVDEGVDTSSLAFQVAIEQVCMFHHCKQFA